MTDELHKYTKQELHSIAGEIVRALSGAVSAASAVTAASEESEKRSRTDSRTEAALALLLSQMENVSSPKQEKAQNVPADVNVPSASAGDIRARFQDTVTETEREEAFPGERSENASVRTSMAEVSEFFRRDSRRYDSGFERY